MSEVDFGQLAGVVVPTVLFLGLFSTIVLLVWFGHRSGETEAALRAETQKRFLNKFDSGSELADFLATDNGQRFLDQLGESKSHKGAFLDRFFDPRARAMRMIVPGIILTLLGLGPVGTVPEFQRRGVGGQLVREGLRICRARSVGFAVVLGHPSCYPRFGFEPASRFGLENEHEADEAFMVRELNQGAMPTGGGLVRYSHEFGELEE